MSLEVNFDTMILTQFRFLICFLSLPEIQISLESVRKDLVHHFDLLHVSFLRLSNNIHYTLQLTASFVFVVCIHDFNIYFQREPKCFSQFGK